MIATPSKATSASNFRPSATLAGLTLAIVAAWAMAFWAEQSGVAATFHHDALYHAARPLWVSGLLLLLTWQVMTAAMMLPSSLPLVRYFVIVSEDAPGREFALGLFLLAYFAVWTGFALAAFSADMALHRAADVWPAFFGHPQIMAATLAAAAVYQLTPLKDACLRACRHPGLYLLRHYRRGALGGWRLGYGHALFCVGCCWALMLIMFAVGVAHLAWMGILAIVTLVEKTAPWGDRLVWPIGAALGLLALVELLRPGVLPGL